MKPLIDSQTIEAMAGASRKDMLARTFAAFSLVIAAVYLARVILGNTAVKDFSYFWVAGQIWLDGGNPYLPSFSGLADAIAAETPEMDGVGGFHRWLYGPHVWPFAIGASLWDYIPARLIWGLSSAGALLWGCYLAAVSVSRQGDAHFFALFGGLVVFASTTIGTAMSVSTGQFGSFMFLGVAAFIYGVLRGSGWAVSLALILLTMKPSVALPFVAFAVTLPATRRPVFWAAVASLALSVPILTASPPMEIVAGYLDGLAAYGSYDANAPNALTGVVNIVHVAFGITLSGVVLALAGAVSGALVGWLAREQGAGREHMALLLACTCFIVPMHLYDMAFVVLFIALWRWPWGCMIAILVNLAMFRVTRLGQMLELNDASSVFPGSFPATLLLFGLLVVACVILLGDRSGAVAQRN